MRIPTNKGVEMNGNRRRNVEGMGRQIPGCFGRMVNLFDFTTSGGGNKMLTDKPHHVGSSLSRSRSTVPSRPSPPMGDCIEDQVVASEVRSATNKVSGTPMKKLIAEEMPKEMNFKLSPSSVVAKLMGFDSVPQPRSYTSDRRSNSKSQLRHEGIAMRYWERDSDHVFQDRREYKDVYEIWQQPGKFNKGRSSMADSERYRESLSEKKMDFVHGKFMEAKRLVTDEKLRHSKEFQDAIEVLSSNKELFLKFLPESSNFFSDHLHDFQSVPSITETKQITILKPLKMTDDEKSAAGQVEKIYKETNRTTNVSTLGNNDGEFGLPLYNQMVGDCPTRLTRIVVLKPSSAKGQISRALASSCPTSPRGVQGEGCEEEFIDFEERDLGDVPRRVTKHIRRNLVERQRNETVQLSFSNGYLCDDSSFDRSENDYMVENLSDSENMSPVSRHSWDYINMYDSPYSSSPFSRASCSPESSVCREAKKRLSERWAVMASNGNFQEEKGIHKSSSTLGEMLVLSDLRKDMRIAEASDGYQQGPRVSTSCLASNLTRDEGDSISPKSLKRSKSVPESSTVYKTRLDLKVTDTIKSKAGVSDEPTKSKSLKWSLKGKVINFLFSRNKKTSKERPSASPRIDESQIATPETPDCRSNCESHSYVPADDGCLKHCSLAGAEQSRRTRSPEADLSIAKPMIPGNARERRDQPSPISVLETSFDEDDGIVPESTIFFKSASLGPEISLQSNLIDKSPPIGSIARSLSCDGSRAGPATAPRCSSKRLASSQDTGDAEEDWRLLVDTLLSAANLDDESLSDIPLSKWHSMESPLEPSLRNEYAKKDDSETVNEAKRLRLSSDRKLVFDLVNSLLSELTTGYYHQHVVRFGKGDDTTLGEQVTARMHEWFAGNEKARCWDEDGDLSSLAVDRAARAEAAATEGGWPENTRGDVYGFGEEMEMKLLEELLDETVTALTQTIP